MTDDRRLCQAHASSSAGGRWAAGFTCSIYTSEEVAMRASVGDRVCIRGNSVGTADRLGEIRQIQGPDGTPPFVVRWDDGHEGLFFPGPDAKIQPTPSTSEA